MSEDKYHEYFRKIEETIKEGKYKFTMDEPRYKDNHHGVIDSTKSVDWNKAEVSRWNKEEYPKLREAYDAEKKHLIDTLCAELVTLFLTLPGVTQKMAERLADIARDNGHSSYWDHFNSDSWGPTAPCLYTSCLNATEELAYVFFD